jgi:serine/threonine-protein kinase
MMPATTLEPALAEEELEEPRGRRTGIYIAALLIMLAVLAGLLVLLGKQLGLFDKASAKEVTIPADIIGADAAQAQSELQNLGLKVAVRQQTSDTAPGKVVDSQPKPGTTVKTGSTVTLIVSGGPQLVQLPDVRGQDVNQATAALTQAGFHVTTAPQASDTVPANQVIAQNPAPGQVPQGSTVTLTVSTGKTKVTIPDQSGQDPNAAANTLGNLGLQTRILYESSSSVPVGKVTRTDPPANASVDTGSTVLIYVSTGSGQVQVPDVRNLTRAQAQAALAADSLQFTVSTAPVTDPTQDGVVIAQSPNPGTTVSKGSTVAITIGQFSPPPTTATSVSPAASTSTSSTSTTLHP